jgi:dolichyl-phosphate beta-glucosyltransferase
MYELLKDITILIPAYNEENCIVRTIETLVDFLEQRFTSYEIIVVDDGSTDRTTDLVEGLMKSQSQHGEIRLLRNMGNKGKGYSVRRGVFESKGRKVLFMDADMPFELSAVDRINAALDNGHPVVVGSRLLADSVIYGMPLIRTFIGKTFRFLVQMLTNSGIQDTQCGIKGFTAQAARDIFQRVTIRGFGFDVESLYISRKLGYSILPVPVNMVRYRLDSRVNIFRDSIKMLVDLFLIRWNDWRGKYDRYSDGRFL